MVLFCRPSPSTSFSSCMQSFRPGSLHWSAFVEVGWSMGDVGSIGAWFSLRVVWERGGTMHGCLLSQSPTPPSLRGEPRNTCFRFLRWKVRCRASPTLLSTCSSSPLLTPLALHASPQPCTVQHTPELQGGVLPAQHGPAPHPFPRGSGSEGRRFPFEPERGVQSIGGAVPIERETKPDT